MLAIDHDLHVHTYLSACCHDKVNHRPARILEAAQRMALRTVGFADHVWVNPALEPSGWYRPQDGTQVQRLREDLDAVTTGVRVLVGCEAETVAPGEFGLTPDFADTLDFVLLACSHFHMRGFVAQPASDEARDVARHLLAFFLSAVESGMATAIPHPFLPNGYTERFDEIAAAISDAEFADAFGAAADRGVGIEITTSFLPPETDGDGAPGAMWHVETPIRILELAKRAGCRFVFASDAHDLEMLAGLGRLARMVGPLGLTGDDILPLVRNG